MALTYRQSEILDYLKEKKHAKIGELAQKLFVSDATIRRELAELKRLGLLERDHGGAVILEAADEVSIFVRQRLGTDDKEETAKVAINKIPPFKSIFIDNSSTALILAQKMDFKHKTVVTNGLVLGMELARREDVTILIPGGNLAYNSNSLRGSLTSRSIGNLRFNLMICSCTAISADGVFESSLDQSEIKIAALKNSTNKILVADKTKFNNEAIYRTCELSEFNAIFTNADDATIAPLKELRGVNIFNK
ncbi:MAG: DeoR/GlpR transcriptional regulator [Clostridia bacterium]|nr:DeoR/GlpR transcriptional regulator [Clostridia bacterium]